MAKDLEVLQSNSLIKLDRRLCIGQVIGRVLAAVSCAVALCILVTSNQTVLVYGVKFEAKYSYSMTFRFVLIADALICGFSALSLVFLRFLEGLTAKEKGYFVLFLHDLVMMVVMVSGCAAGTAVGYVSHYGQEKMGWLPFCDRVETFCKRVLVSVVFSYVAFFCYAALTVISVKKLMSMARRIN